MAHSIEDQSDLMATSEKKIGLGKIGKKPRRVCTDCGMFVRSTTGWINHTFLAHNDHKVTGDVLKSTKVAHKEAGHDQLLPPRISR